MRFRSRAAVVLGAGLLIAAVATGVSQGAPGASDERGDAPGLSEGFKPAAVRAQQDLGRYFVVTEGQSVAQATKRADDLSAAAERQVAAAARDSQAGAISAARSLGGQVLFRYDTLINGFSANLSPSAASDLAARDDVKAVQPVSIVQKLN